MTKSSGGTPSTGNSEYYDGKILWFQSGEVCEKDLYKSKKTITESGLKNSSAKIGIIQDLQINPTSPISLYSTANRRRIKC